MFISSGCSLDQSYLCIKTPGTQTNQVHVAFTSEYLQAILGKPVVSHYFLAHLAYMPMSLYNHDLSVMCHCHHHWCCHHHCIGVIVCVQLSQ